MLYSYKGGYPSETKDGRDGWIEVIDKPTPPPGKIVEWSYPPGWLIVTPCPNPILNEDGSENKELKWKYSPAYNRWELHELNVGWIHYKETDENGVETGNLLMRPKGNVNSNSWSLITFVNALDPGDQVDSVLIKFAEINSSNVVVRVVPVEKKHCVNDTGVFFEEIGINYMSNTYGSGTWIWTTDGIRGTVAREGYIYNTDTNVFETPV